MVNEKTSKKKVWRMKGCYQKKTKKGGLRKKMKKTMRRQKKGGSCGLCSGQMGGSCGLCSGQMGVQQMGVKQMGVQQMGGMNMGVQQMGGMNMGGMQMGGLTTHVGSAWSPQISNWSGVQGAHGGSWLSKNNYVNGDPQYQTINERNIQFSNMSGKGYVPVLKGG